MSTAFLDIKNLPYCKGCSHHSIARNTDKALQKLGLNPLDVILVTDIGCHGIIDKKSYTHTVHGLHGRSVALAAGISAALSDPGKKVIVFIGDGGTTIGINHLIGAAHRNFDMTVVVHNNMLYGMTGGQQSDLTPGSFCTSTSISGFPEQELELAKIISAAGAAYVNRIEARGDFSDALAEAMTVKGFSLVEVLEICPSYGTKNNDDLKTSGLLESSSSSVEKHLSGKTHFVEFTRKKNPASLLDNLEDIPVKYQSGLKDETTILLGGSAGSGVQAAAGIVLQAAMSCGLQVMKRGLYPVTVGIGYSVAEIILSRKNVTFTGIRHIDYMLLSSDDGAAYLKKRIAGMSTGTILKEGGIEIDANGPTIYSHDFASSIGRRDINLALLFALTGVTDVIPLEALVDALSRNRLAKNINLDDFVTLAGVFGK